MKKSIQLIAALLLGMTMHAQDPVQISMGSGYADRVFFKLNNLEDVNYSGTEWDLAFYRMSNYSFATRINDTKGIKAYEASNDPSDWSSIDVSQVGTWTPLYNSDTDWLMGAIDQGSATYGWGEYNPVTHHVEGTIVFVLEYSGGTYRKFMIEDFYGGYTFKYSTWNGSNWSADNTVTVSNTSNEDNMFNYYSLETNSEVLAEPAFHLWDLVFTKYTTDVGGGMMYSVTGVLHRPELVVAEHDETSGTPDLENLDYQEAINTIGYDWKTFNGTGYDVNSDTGYYIKFPNTQIYRVLFTEFEGSSNGNVEFEVTYMGQLDSEDFAQNGGFSLYPNPAAGQVDLVFEMPESENNIEINVFNLTGKNVLKTSIVHSGSFTQKTLDISSLSSGMYLVQINSGKNFITRKLVVNPLGVIK